MLSSKCAQFFCLEPLLARDAWNMEWVYEITASNCGMELFEQTVQHLYLYSYWLLRVLSLNDVALYETVNIVWICHRIDLLVNGHLCALPHHGCTMCFGPLYNARLPTVKCVIHWFLAWIKRLHQIFDEVKIWGCKREIHNKCNSVCDHISQRSVTNQQTLMQKVITFINL